jgi:hypothetical protein
MYDKYIERLRQTLKDTKSIGVNKLSSMEKYDYLYNRCMDIVTEYDEDYNEHIDMLWEETKNEEEKRAKEKAEDKTYEKENS